LRKLILSFLAGTLFGLGLCVSQMIDPQKVIAFLDVSGNWDPSLAFVMIGALLVTVISFPLVLRRPSPFWGECFAVPATRKIDGPLITGSILFGIGWGLAGLCPGPAIAGLAYGMHKSIIFVLAMISGMIIYQIWSNWTISKSSQKE